MLTRNINSPVKILVLAERADFPVFDVFNDKSADEVKASLNAWCDNIGNEHLIFHVEHPGYDGGFNVVCNFYRLETDEEFDRRQKALITEALRQQKRQLKYLAKCEVEAKKLLEQQKLTEQEERQLYTALKKKFEDKE